MHWSDELRPHGDKFIKNIIESIEKFIKYDYIIYVIDNESQHHFDFSNYKNVKYYRINDQSLEGITGAWNVGINMAYEDGCDIIINSNDDIVMNDTINKMVEHISLDKESDDCMYGVMTNGTVLDSQRSNTPLSGIIKVIVFNTFLFGITKKHYEKFRFKNKTYFNINNKHNDGDGKWGGQEGQLIENCNEKKMICKVLKFVWVDHQKQRGWKKSKVLYSKKLQTSNGII